MPSVQDGRVRSRSHGDADEDVVGRVRRHRGDGGLPGGHGPDRQVAQVVEDQCLSLLLGETAESLDESDPGLVDGG